MPDSRQPRELFELLEILESLRFYFRVAVRAPFGTALESLDIIEPADDNPQSQPPPTPPLFDQPLNDELHDEGEADEDEDEDDTPHCPHPNIWDLRENRSVTVIGTVLRSVREAIGLLYDATRDASAADASWDPSDPHANNAAMLLRLKDSIDNIQDYLDNQVFQVFKSTLDSLACINECNGPMDPVLAWSPTQPINPTTYPEGEDLSHSSVCTILSGSLRAATTVFKKLDYKISTLQHKAFLYWKAFDRCQAEEASMPIPVLNPTPELSVAHPPAVPLDQQLAQDADVPRTSPIVQLPPEIFSNVAVSANDQDPRIPRTLQALNTHFRDFANTDPWLWKDVHVLLPPSEAVSRFGRAGQQTPFLDVSMSFPPQDSVRNGWEILMDFGLLLSAAVFDHVRSFTAVTVHRCWSSAAIAFLENTESQLPKLTTLDIGLENSSHFLTLPTFPALKIATTVRLRQVQFTPADLPSMSQVIDLTVDGCMTPDLPSLLKAVGRMKSLKYLHLRDIRRSALSSTPWIPETLPNLTYANLERLGLDATREVFAGLNLPRLETLLIMPKWGGHQDPTGSELRTILATYASGVKYLEIFGGMMDSWGTLFTGLLSLTRLHISKCRIRDVDLADLAGIGNTFPCPKLSHLELSMVEPVTTRVVRKIVNARHSHCTPIASVTLRGWFTTQINAADVAELQEKVKLVLNGVDITSVITDQNVSFGTDSSFTNSEGDLSADSLSLIAAGAGAAGSTSGQRTLRPLSVLIPIP